MMGGHKRVARGSGRLSPSVCRLFIRAVFGVGAGLTGRARVGGDRNECRDSAHELAAI
jgi:hypothetical protein